MSEPAFSLTLPGSDGQSWPAQGEWTYEDYLRLPDDGRRYEIIRGFLYVTPAPSFDHQYTVTQASRFLATFVDEKRLGVVLVAPFDIRLPEGIGNPVQPDVLFIRRERQPRSGDLRFDGVPDLAIEVLSPGNWRFDRKTKRAAYRDAGIPEFWLVDPLARTVEVLVLAPDRSEYVLRERREGEAVGSTVLPGLRIDVARLFTPAEESEAE
jgi:Uma2 family endonuclease